MLVSPGAMSYTEPITGMLIVLPCTHGSRPRLGPQVPTHPRIWLPQISLQSRHSYPLLQTSLLHDSWRYYITEILRPFHITSSTVIKINVEKTTREYSEFIITFRTSHITRPIKLNSQQLYMTPVII